MKTIKLLLFLILFSASPVSLLKAQVTSDYDKNADFSKYKTYSFLGWEKDSDKQLTDFDKKRILESFKAEFDKRGMTLVESEGDASITLFLVIENKTSTTAYTNYNGGMGYRGGWGWGAGMGSSTTTYSEDDYREGTMVVDMYDNESKSLVWQGVIQSVVKEKPAQREKSIPKKVDKLMYKFPIKPVN